MFEGGCGCGEAAGAEVAFTTILVTFLGVAAERGAAGEAEEAAVKEEDFWRSVLVTTDLEATAATQRRRRKLPRQGRR